MIHNPELQVLIPTMSPPCKVPSHETIRTILLLTPPKVMEAFFAKHFSSANSEIAKVPYNFSVEPDDQSKVFRPTYGLEGQEVKSSYRKGEYSRTKKAGIAVSVYDSDEHTVKGYTVTNAKNNEASALVLILNTIKVQDAIICADAINTKEAVLNALNERKLDYLLPVKANRKVLLNAITDAFDKTKTSKTLTGSFTESISGRIIVRKFTLIKAPSLPDEKNIFTRVTSLLMYETTTQRVLKSNVEGALDPTTKIKYYICSLKPNEDTLHQLAHSIDVYWNIEQHHNTLDTVFLQDSLNISNKEHLAMRVGLNKMVYNVLSFERQQHLVQTNKTLTFTGLREDLCNPLGALQVLARYWMNGAPQAIKPPRAVSKLIID